MRLIYAGTTTQKESNEDYFGYTETAAWVLDGATGSGRNVAHGQSDSQWFALSISTHLVELTSRPDSTLSDDVFTAIRRTATEFRSLADAPEDVTPSPSVTLAAIKEVSDANGNYLEICLLGDCNALVQRGDVWKPYADRRASALEGPLAIAIRDFVASGKGDAIAAREHYSEWFEYNRSRRNIDYFAACEGLKQENILCERVTLQSPASVVLSTDGAYRLVDVFATLSADQYASLATEQGVHALLKMALETESADPDVRIHARTKPWDDATVLVARFV